MRRLRPLLVLMLASQSVTAQDVYRWVSKDGEVHYTDDPTTIPKGMKAVSTSGAELGELKVGPAARPPAPAAAPRVERPGAPSSALLDLLIRAETLAKSGHAPRAFEAITEAVGLAANDFDRRGIASSCGRIALERVESGFVDDAGRFVVKGRESDPEDPTLCLASGEVALAQGDQPKALEEWEKGLRRSPSDPALKRRLEELRGRSKAFGGLGVTTSKWVTVSFDGAEDAALAVFVVKTIEDARASINEHYGYTGTQRVEVVLYPGRSFDTSSPNHPSWAGGFYDGKIHLPTGGAAKLTGSLATTLLHEYGHRLLARVVGPRSVVTERTADGKLRVDVSKSAGAPAWLDEGMAQLAPYLATGGTIACVQGHSFPLRSLHRGFATAGADVFPRYLEAQHAVEWVMKKYGRSSVKDVLRRMGEGASFDDAFDRATGTSYPDFADAFDKKGAEH